MGAHAKALPSDITSLSREALELQLFETRNLLNLVLENNPFAYFWKDLDLIYRGGNQNFAQCAGVERPVDFVGMTDYEMPWGVGNEIGANACRASDIAVIESGVGQMHLIEQIKAKDGQVTWTSTSKVPIRDADGNVVGVLGLLENITERKLAEEALENANAQLEALCRIDGLTGIANRRHMDERLDVECARAMRDHSALSIILLDIDHFKKFNDRYGHPAGDACLVAVANCTAERILRPADLIARYGGEEFLVVLPDTDIKGATAIAEKIRAAVAEIDLAIESDGQKAKLSVSLGVASCYPRDKNVALPLILAADQALYRAKSGGRNRLEVAI